MAYEIIIGPLIFNADQRGMYTWTYNFTSTSDNSNVAATHFSWGTRVPLLSSCFLPKGSKDQSKSDEISLVSDIPEHVLLVNVHPIETENALLFHFREMDDKKASFVPKTIKGKVHWFETDVLGRQTKQVKKLDLEGLESKFYKLKWD